MTIHCLFAIAACSLTCLAGDDVVRSWSGAAPVAQLETSEDGWSRIATEDDGWLPAVDEVGAPALPRKTVYFAVPDGMRVSAFSAETEWEDFAEAVRVVPVAEPSRVSEAAAAPVPDAEIYGSPAAYPAAAVVTGRLERLCGVAVLPVTVTPFRWHPDSGLLERATAIRLKVEFADGATRSFVTASQLEEVVRDAVVNPEDVSQESSVRKIAPKRLAAQSPKMSTATEHVDYLLVSPPDFVADWQWYVGKRAETHPDIRFRVVNTFDIYEAYPYGDGKACRNPAESIHAYLRDNRTSMGFSYVVLGGAWLDAQNLKKTSPRFYGGEPMTLTNCVPGVYGYPREEWREIPSDMFYACLDLPETQKYPWDADEDGVYINQSDCSNNDLMPDVAVSRITLNPYRAGGAMAYNRHTLVTNYVDKLERGERKSFGGHYRYGVSPDSTGSKRRRSSGDRMFYKELEFYHGMYNMFDPRHSEWIEDNEYSACGRLRYQFSTWRPVLETKGMMSYTWTKGQPTLAAAINDYYASDRDYGFVYSHGWAQGATHFQAGRFATAEGLTLLNGSNGPCDTGYVDYHVNMNGVLTLQYNLGDSGVTNPEGGALCSINNTRWGWAGGSNGWDESMSYLMLNRSLIGFNQLGMNVGQSWLKGVRDYASMGGPMRGGTSTWTLTEQICYGDPLVKLPRLADAWWNGDAAGGVWDGKTPCWTNNVDADLVYAPSSNVYFDVKRDFSLDIASPIAAMRLSLPVYAPGAKLRFAGEGSLRVMKAIDVAGEDVELTLGAGGGVGHDGVRFVTSPGTLVLEGTNAIYLSRVVNAAALRLDGAGAIVDVDEFPDGVLVPLSVTGRSGATRPEPNVLRSSVAGGLRRFGNFGITNSYVQLSTVDAFGKDPAAPAHISLKDAHLDIGANVYYERYTCMEGLNAVFEVDGKARLSSSVGGLFTVKHTTVFNLAENAKLTLAAKSVDGGGRIVINGGGEATLEVPLADALSGDVTVGSGVRLVLDALPLENVKRLTLYEGAELVLPHAVSGYWQLLPLSSTLECPEGVKIYDAADLEHPLDGTPSATGSFFRKGALYTWSAAEGDWNEDLADKLVFADVDGGSARVRVVGNVAPSFAYFANGSTHYVFEPSVAGDSIVFNGVILCGETDFGLPVCAREYVSLTSGTSRFERVIAPYVTVSAGAALALAGSHWTEFRLADGAVLKAVSGAAFDWNLDTEIVFPTDGKVRLDLDSLELGDEPTVIIGGEGRVWTEDDFSRFELSRDDAELRIDGGALAVVKGSGLKSPYSLVWSGTVGWNEAEWTASNAPFAAAWSDCTLNERSTILLSPAGEADVLRLDCQVRAKELVISSASTNEFTLAAAGVESVEVGTIDLTDVLGAATFSVSVGSASVLTPTNADARCVFDAADNGTITMRGSTIALKRPGEWLLAAGAQGDLVVMVPPTNRVVRLARLENGFEYPNGGFAVRVVDEDGGERTDCHVVKEGDSLVLVPSVLDVSNLDFEELCANAVAGAPYSHWLVRGALGGTVSVEGIPDELPPGVTITLETSAQGVRLICRADEKRLGSISINFSGGRDNQSNLPASRVSDNDSYRLLPHGAHSVVGTNWNDIAAANGSYIAKTVVKRDGAVETNAAVRVALSQVANPYATGVNSGDRILYGYVDDGKGPIAELSGIPFAKYRVIVYRSTDNGGTVFDSCRIGTCEKDAIHYYGPTSRDVSGGVTLSGSEEMGWGSTNIRDPLREGVNYIVSGVLSGGRAYLAQRRSQGRACLSAIQIVEVEGEVATDPTDDDPALELHAVSTADARWSRLEWLKGDGTAVDVVDWSRVKSVELSAAAGITVDFDRGEFAGALTLRGGVALESHELPSFTLQHSSTGAVRYLYTLEPPANTVIVATAADFEGTSEAVTVACESRLGVESAVYASVGWKQGGYYLHVDAFDNPTYSLTFDGSTDRTITQSIGLSGGTSDTRYFEKSRGGQALTGTCPYFSMTVPAVWTLNIVARMPDNENGIIFGMGKGPYADRGVGLASAGGDCVALIVWNGWTTRRLIVADVEFATRQFHSYAIVSDGESLAFFVDGAKIGESAAAGYPSDGNCQFFTCHSARPNNVEVGSNGAIDDWRFYSGIALTAESVRGVAAEFEPWPECRKAVVTNPNQTMESLVWSEGEATMPRLLETKGGSLCVASEYVFDVPVRTRGRELAIAFAEDAVVVAAEGLTVGAPLVLDVGAFDGEALAANAVVGAPYSRWLVRGTVAGAITVTNTPAMPQGYSIKAETLASAGVRLVVTAPRFAKFGSLGFNFAGSDDKSVNAVGSRVSDNASYSSLLHGAHPVVGSDWHDLAAANATSTVSGVRVAVSGVANAYGTKTAVGDRILYGYADDGANPTVEVSGIPYEKFRVIVYLATDNANTYFCPVRIGATAADARRYFGPTRGSATGGYTLSGALDTGWGDTDLRDALTEGINYIVSDVISGEAGSATAYLHLNKLAPGRACLAAFQIVEVGRVFETEAVDYVAEVAADTAWNDGKGEGLVTDDVWKNDTCGTITLSPSADSPRLVFDTAVTADMVRVESETGRRLTLAQATGVPFEVDTLDLSVARGETVLSNWISAVKLEVREGTRVRFEDAQTAPRLTELETIVSYRKAVFASAISPFNWILRLEEPDDEVTLNGGWQYLPIDVAAGTLYYGATSVAQTGYGGHASTLTNSVMSVSGGRVVCRTTGTSLANSGNSRGFILGATQSSGTRNHVLAVSGGEFDCSGGLFAPWEYARIRLDGGVFKAKGVWKGGGTQSVFEMRGGTLELGALGMGRRTGAGGAFTVKLAGGRLLATDNAEISVAPEASGAVTVAAADGCRLGFTAGVTGTGAIVCGADGYAGTVEFVRGVDPGVALSGAFVLRLTSEQTNSTAAVSLFRLGEGFSADGFDLRGPDGGEPAGGSLEYRDGSAVWVPTTAVALDADTTIEVPLSWLREYGFDPADIAANPARREANGISAAASYALGLDPTNAHEDVRCDLSMHADGTVVVALPNVNPQRQPDSGSIRYVLQRKRQIDAPWTDHSTNELPTVLIRRDSASSEFYRYLIRIGDPDPK